VPKTRTDWWLQKINNNITNDDKAIAALKQLGYKVIIIWECGLKPAMIEKTFTKLLSQINK
jgi:DNA mismatch endonuclease (patch repair protein)